MKDSLKNIIPIDCESYNISHDANLANSGIYIMNWLQDNNKIKLTHSYGGIDYRWAFGISGIGSIDYISDSLPIQLKNTFNNDIIDYLGIRNLNVNEIKFEILGPNNLVDNIHLKRCRFGEIVPVLDDDMPIEYEKTIFYSSLWHTDKSFELNNYKILVYLNDINVNQGGLMIADPIMSPKMIESKCVLHESGVKYNSDTIKSKEVIGAAGTCSSFNSHILHRANLPKYGYRYCMHLSFLLNDSKYYHNAYSKKHIK